MKRAATFITGFNESLVKAQFTSDDITHEFRWKAHKDFINQVTYVPELDVFATCSFDCNVYMWKWQEVTREIEVEEEDPDHPGDKSKIRTVTKTETKLRMKQVGSFLQNEPSAYSQASCQALSKTNAFQNYQ